ncbi:UvrABC system protein B [Desulfurobacterium thermolithotrophum DSM 11699]|uniref:UvrABC system protein B n=1 Tax=Desulfurobacterium thermolithotrophum (strain DSM 11699 / BSA) TaxID=868864 RepID=F0S3A7_DESTD|nr:excinuclease ABC subunit UvrB [Desulfurobacterium thermolithotrophum]ADY73329.1 UvrABC system protein B [Desulfurobacterium thermolithotrophum DSM 11699]
MKRRFKVVSPFKPKGDQPKAIKELSEGIKKGLKYQTLLGITGSGKTYTIAKVIEEVQKPTLVISHNKVLAAQLYHELKNFFPENAVEYFISYYDYYQPESYIPSRDLYIEKDCSINPVIDRMRHSATVSLLTRQDVIVVSSVSCIYGLGSPDYYKTLSLRFQVGEEIERDEVIRKLVTLGYERSEYELKPGIFKVRGDVIDIFPADVEDHFVRVELFGDEVDSIVMLDYFNQKVLKEFNSYTVYPASHYATPYSKIVEAVQSIEKELEERVKYFLREGKELEARRIEQRTKYDIELLLEIGHCKGIENYSRHLDGRKPGEPPFTLLNYFPDDFLVVIDESHVTVPQIKAMWRGDRARKYNLIEHGFRLPSAYDNRPLNFEEFLKRVPQAIFVSATPGPFELEVSEKVVEQIIRPTGLLDPIVEVRKTEGQIDHLISEIKKRVEKNERILITTLTKKSAEELSKYLLEKGIKAKYMHSEIDSVERVEIIRGLRSGEFDVLVGVNLLREGLDLPEVSLVAILDADKEGFLRSTTSLIQTIGRAARNVNGKVILYADKITPSMKKAIEETERRRKIQKEYNKKYGITPQTVKRALETSILEDAGIMPFYKKEERENTPKTEEELLKEIARLEKEMKEAAKNWEFERAAELRDKIKELQKLLIPS